MFNTLWDSPATDKAARSSFLHSYSRHQDTSALFTLVKGFAIINHTIKHTHSLVFIYFHYLQCGAGLIGHGRVEGGHNKSTKVITPLYLLACRGNFCSFVLPKWDKWLSSAYKCSKQAALQCTILKPFTLAHCCAGICSVQCTGKFEILDVPKQCQLKEMMGFVVYSSWDQHRALSAPILVRVQ